MTRSRGALLFKRVGSTQAELARRLSVGTGIVAMWQSGQRKPGIPNRKLLLDQFRIPIESWDEEPESAVAASPIKKSSVDWGPTTVLSRIETLERIVEDTLSRVESDADMTLLEQAKVMSLLGRTLGELRRLKGEEVAEIRVLRHPKWIEVRTAIVEALGDHPEALASVVSSLEVAEQKTA